ncbi:MAG: Ca2+-binding RTX toxin-like protein, partial [Oleiphilaceae bacterium]
MQSGISKHFKKALLATAIVSGFCTHVNAEIIQGKDLNSSVGSNETISSLYSANRGNGGDQSLQFGDALYGTSNDDVIIGGLGIDVLWGKDGDDILIGGTEDFNPANRDQAFGGEGNDVFLWAPGDGNDYFDGGNDIDVLVLGLIGESTGSSDNGELAPFFQVSTSADFDGIYLDENN